MKTLELGVVIRPHGIRGELKVKLHFEHSETLLGVPRLIAHLQDGASPEFEIVAARRQQQGILLRLKGVDSRDDAEALRGARVAVDRALLDELGPDEYYLADLVGCQVQAPDGPVGVVLEVMTHPTIDSLVIQTPEGSTLEQPIDDAWVESVSTQQQRVVLRSRDGLIGKD